MYGFSAPADFAFLNGKSVQQVAFSAYQVDLLFDGGGGITLHGPFHLTDGSIVSSGVGGETKSATILIDLVEDMITEVRSPAKDRLALVFQSGKSLELIDNSPQYELFEFFGSFGRIIV